MIVQFTTDNHIKGDDMLFTQYRELVEHAMKRFGDRVSRVVVSLSDENSDKAGGNDKRCMVEARLDGMAPQAVTARAENLDQAMRDALDKLKSALTSVVGKQRPY
jgi:hypothetical protein